MNELKFDTGLVRLHVQGDPNRELVFNPADGRTVASFLELINHAEEKFADLREKEAALNTRMSEMEDIDVVKEKSAIEREADEVVCKELDRVFGEGTSNIVFQEASATALASNGDYVFMNFLMALFPYFEKEIKNRSGKVADIIQDHKKAAKKKVK